MARGVIELGRRMANLSTAEAARTAVLARRAAAQARRPKAAVDRHGAGADTIAACSAARAYPSKSAPAGLGPDATQLRRLAEVVELPQVLLPGPQAALPDGPQLARLLARVDFSRAAAPAPTREVGVADGPLTSQPARPSTDAAAATPGTAASPAAAPGTTEPPRTGWLDAWLTHALGPADLQRLRQLLRLSPRQDRALSTLLRQDADGAAASASPSPNAADGPAPHAADGAAGRTLLAASPDTGTGADAGAALVGGNGGDTAASAPAPRTGASDGAGRGALRAAVGRAAGALSFSLRGNRAAAATPGSVADAAATEPRRMAAVPARMSWSGFAALLSQQQLRALFDASLLRLRDVFRQNEAEQLALAHDRQRTHDEIGLARLVAALQWFSEAFGAAADFRTGQVSVLRNAVKPLARGASNLVQNDGLEAAEVRARLARLQRGAAARTPAGPGRAGGPLDWVPAAGGRPAQRLARLVLEPEDLTALSADERRDWEADAARLKALEEGDLANVFGRLALSAAQLEQAAARCRQAAAEGTDAAAAGVGDAAALHQLADAYDARASRQRARALHCGYLEGAMAVGRRQKGELAESIQFEAERRATAEAERGRLATALDDAGQAPGARDAMQARLQQLEVELTDRDARLAGMHLAVVATDAWRAASARGRPDAGWLRQSWARLRPLDPAAGAAAQAAAGAPFDALLRPQGPDLLREGGTREYLGQLGEAGARWAQGYDDKSFRRADRFNRFWGPAALQYFTPASQTLSRLAEGGVAELAAYFEADRDAFFAALDREQARTRGLVDQLRSLLRVAS